MSQMTKRALAASLKKLLADRPLDKVTVTDIAEDCGVGRQTFYYHFEDIYGLVEWIYTSEAGQALAGNKTHATWQEGYLRIFEYVKANRVFVRATYHSAGREHLIRYIYGETYQLLSGVVEELARGIPVRDEDKNFIANFYKYAFAGLLLDWVAAGMKEDPEALVSRLSVLLEGHLAGELERFRTDRVHPAP